MCDCQQMVRTFEETQGGIYPPSNHAPSCQDYMQIKYLRLVIDNTAAIFEESEGLAIISESQDSYEVSEIMLTADQFERLPEFKGW